RPPRHDQSQGSSRADSDAGSMALHHRWQIHPATKLAFSSQADCPAAAGCGNSCVESADGPILQSKRFPLALAEESEQVDLLFHGPWFLQERRAHRSAVFNGTSI